MTRPGRVLVIVMVLIWGLGIDAIGASVVTEQLRASVDRVIKTLDDPALKAKAAERRQAIRAISNEIFDWTEMAKRSLGRHWTSVPPDQREEFVRLFTNLIEAGYIAKIESYSGEKVDYVSESIEGDQATVRTKIVTKAGQGVPVDYRMLRQGERWLIYDVSVENVSLVNNYRSQFDKVLATSSYQELLRRLKAQTLGKD